MQYNLRPRAGRNIPPPTAVKLFELPEDVLGLLADLSGNRHCLRACSRASRSRIPVKRSPRHDDFEKLRQNLGCGSIPFRLNEIVYKFLPQVAKSIPGPGAAETTWVTLRLCAATLPDDPAGKDERSEWRDRPPRNGLLYSYDAALKQVVLKAAGVDRLGGALPGPPNAEVWEALHQYLRQFHPLEAASYARWVLHLCLHARVRRGAVCDATLAFLAGLVEVLAEPPGSSLRVHCSFFEWAALHRDVRLLSLLASTRPPLGAEPLPQGLLRLVGLDTQHVLLDWLLASGYVAEARALCDAPVDAAARDTPLPHIPPPLAGGSGRVWRQACRAKLEELERASDPRGGPSRN